MKGQEKLRKRKIRLDLMCIMRVLKALIRGTFHVLYYRDETRSTCKIEIGDRVSVGARSIITKGVKIGDDALIGPSSIVTRSVEAGSFVLGNPAKEVRADT